MSSVVTLDETLVSRVRVAGPGDRVNPLLVNTTTSDGVVLTYRPPKPFPSKPETPAGRAFVEACQAFEDEAGLKWPKTFADHMPEPEALAKFFSFFPCRSPFHTFMEDGAFYQCHTHFQDFFGVFPHNQVVVWPGFIAHRILSPRDCDNALLGFERLNSEVSDTGPAEDFYEEFSVCDPRSLEEALREAKEAVEAGRGDEDPEDKKKKGPKRVKPAILPHEHGIDEQELNVLGVNLFSTEVLTRFLQDPQATACLSRRFFEDLAHECSLSATFHNLSEALYWHLDDHEWEIRGMEWDLAVDEILRDASVPLEAGDVSKRTLPFTTGDGTVSARPLFDAGAVLRAVRARYPDRKGREIKVLTETLLTKAVDKFYFTKALADADFPTRIVFEHPDLIMMHPFVRNGILPFLRWVRTQKDFTKCPPTVILGFDIYFSGGNAHANIITLRRHPDSTFTFQHIEPHNTYSHGSTSWYKATQHLAKSFSTFIATMAGVEATHKSTPVGDSLAILQTSDDFCQSWILLFGALMAQNPDTDWKTLSESLYAPQYHVLRLWHYVYSRLTQRSPILPVKTQASLLPFRDYRPHFDWDETHVRCKGCKGRSGGEVPYMTFITKTSFGDGGFYFFNTELEKKGGHRKVATKIPPAFMLQEAATLASACTLSVILRQKPKAEPKAFPPTLAPMGMVRSAVLTRYRPSEWLSTHTRDPVVQAMNFESKSVREENKEFLEDLLEDRQVIDVEIPISVHEEVWEAYCEKVRAAASPEVEEAMRRLRTMVDFKDNRGMAVLARETMGPCAALQIGEACEVLENPEAEIVIINQASFDIATHLVEGLPPSMKKRVVHAASVFPDEPAAYFKTRAVVVVGDTFARDYNTVLWERRLSILREMGAMNTRCLAFVVQRTFNKFRGFHIHSCISNPQPLHKRAKTEEDHAALRLLDKHYVFPGGHRLSSRLSMVFPAPIPMSFDSTSVSPIFHLGWFPSQEPDGEDVVCGPIFDFVAPSEEVVERCREALNRVEF